MSSNINDNIDTSLPAETGGTYVGLVLKTTFIAVLNALKAGLTTAKGEVTALQAGKLDASQLGVANGAASLGSDGKLPSAQLPALAITSTSVVANQAAQLALVAQEGDVAVRSDLSKAFIKNSGTAGTMADWTELLTPTDLVLSVMGKTGAITAADLGLDKTITAVKSSIKAAIQSAYNHNSVEQAPWSVAPTWTTATDFGYGTLVRGTGADAVNLYYLIGSTTEYGNTAVLFGTSAAAGTGPSGEGNGFIADNNLYWIYHGKAEINAGVFPLYSTVTPTTAADVMNGYVAFSAQANLAAMGLTKVYQDTAAAPIFDVTGVNTKDAKFVDTTSQPPYITYAGANSGTVAAPNYTQGRVHKWLYTNARKWLAIYPGNGWGMDHGRQLQIEVNGRRLSETPVYVKTATGANVLLLNLAKFGGGKKKVEISTILSAGAQHIWSQVAVQADETVWFGGEPNELRMSFEGDSTVIQSYFAGLLATAVQYEYLIAKNLGITRYFNNAIGGTGAIANNGGVSTTYLQRLPDIVSFKPDIHVIGSFHNDVGSASATRIAAFTALFQATRTGLPLATIVVVPLNALRNEKITTGGGNSLYDLEVDVKSAFDTVFGADTNALFIPMLLASKPYIVSDADGWDYQGSLAAPYNDGHPTTRYYQHVCRYIADKIRQFYAS